MKSLEIYNLRKHRENNQTETTIRKDCNLFIIHLK
jgi:hypothetical protein